MLWTTSPVTWPPQGVQFAKVPSLTRKRSAQECTRRDRSICFVLMGLGPQNDGSLGAHLSMTSGDFPKRASSCARSSRPGSLPDRSRFTAHGSIAYLAQSAARLTVRVRSERLPDGRILFAAHAGGED